MSKPALKQDLVLIEQNYTQLAHMMKRFESSDFTILRAYFEITNLNFTNNIANVEPYPIKRIERTDAKKIAEATLNLNPNLIVKLQNCQPTSAAVRRSFSKLN